jgi:DnaJ-class molecular chaperone
MLSNIQIEIILKKAASAYDANRLAKSKREQFLTCLRSTLLMDLVKNDVCHACLGTGKKNDLFLSVGHGVPCKKCGDTDNWICGCGMK